MHRPAVRDCPLLRPPPLQSGSQDVCNQDARSPSPRRVSVLHSRGAQPRIAEEDSGAPPPPPPPPKQQQQQHPDVERPSSASVAADARASRPNGRAPEVAAAQPAQAPIEAQPERETTQQPQPAAQQRRASDGKAGSGAGEQNGPAGEGKAAAAAAGAPQGGKAGGKRDMQAAAVAPPPPPPPAAAKPPQQPQLAARISVVKPGVSWRAMVAGVPDGSAVSPLQPLGTGDDGERSDTGKGKRGKEGKKEAAPAAAPASAAGAAAAAGGAPKQRSKRAARGKKGGSQGGEDDVPPQDGAGQQEPQERSVPAAADGKSSRSRGRGRGKGTADQPAADQPAGEPAASAALAAAAEPAALLPAEAEAEPAAPATGAAAEVAAGMPPSLQPDAQLEAPAVAAPLLQPAAAPTATAAGVVAPLMGAAFGWSSPLADEVAKLQLSAASSATQPAAGSGMAAQLGAPTADQLASSMALLPTLGPDLGQPSPALPPAQQGLAATAALPVDSMADVITSLPADLSLDLSAAPPATAVAASAAVLGASASFPSTSPPPPSASPPPFPGGLFPATGASWHAQLPSKVSTRILRCGHGRAAESAAAQLLCRGAPPDPLCACRPSSPGLPQEAVQLFESAGPTHHAFSSFGGLGSHMQFGPVAAAFGQQQQQFGHGGGVDWSSPAPSPPPVLGAAGLSYGQPLQHHMQQGMAQGMAQGMQPGGGHGMPHGARGAAQPLEDPAAALPDDVFDAPPLHYQYGQQAQQMQGNGQQRGRGYAVRPGRRRDPRYPPQHPQHQQHPQHHMQQNGGYGVAQQHAAAAYAPQGAAFPPQMPGWWVLAGRGTLGAAPTELGAPGHAAPRAGVDTSALCPSSVLCRPSHAPHFLPPQLVGQRQQQGSSGRGRGRGRSTGVSRGGAGRQQKPPQQRPE